VTVDGGEVVDDEDKEEEGVAEVDEIDEGEDEGEGVAVVPDEVGVDAGEVRPPQVQTPSVPSGILGPKYVKGSSTRVELVTTAPPGCVISEVENDK
jgi:hypothetical protein